MSTVRDRDVFTYKNYVFFWKPSKLDLTSFLLVKYVANFTGDFIKKRAIKFRRRESECWLPLECLSASDSAASLWLNTHWEFLAAEIPRSLCGFYFFLSRVNDWIISNRAKAVKKIQSLDINTSICCLISVELSEETLFLPSVLLGSSSKRWWTRMVDSLLSSVSKKVRLLIMCALKIKSSVRTGPDSQGLKIMLRWPK